MHGILSSKVHVDPNSLYVCVCGCVCVCKIEQMVVEDMWSGSATEDGESEIHLVSGQLGELMCRWEGVGGGVPQTVW